MGTGNNSIDVSINVNSQNLVMAEKVASKLATTLNKIAEPRKIAGSTAAAKANDQIDYNVTRGITGQTGAASRDFAKQAQGLGGLVHLYATFAANIFAVGSAFIFLNNAFNYEKMIEGAKVLESTTGVALRSIANNMVKISEGALSMQESLKFTALASSAGISSKNIEALTKVAKGASLALGRDMGDSIDRIIRGVSKLEPELVDELGITVKSMQAYKDYAKTLGVTVESLTSYQKTAAYTLAVINEGTRKFGDVSKSVESSPFSKFVGELKNAGTQILNIINNTITPVLSTMANNIELIFAGILIAVKALVVRAIPAISSIFTVPPEVIAKQQSQILELQAQIAESNVVKLQEAAQTANAEVKIQEEKIAKMKSLAITQINTLATTAFKDPNGQSAKNLSDISSIDALTRDARLGSTIKAATTRENKAELALMKEVEITEASILKLDKSQLLLKAEIVKTEEQLQMSKIGASQAQKLLNETEQKRILSLKSELNNKAIILNTYKEELAISKENLVSTISRKNSLMQIQALLAQNALELQGATATQRELLNLEQQRLLALKDAAIATQSQQATSKAQTVLLEHQLTLAKLNRDQAVQTALFIEGKQRAEIVRAQYQLGVEEARWDKARKSKLLTSPVYTEPAMGPNNVRINSIKTELREVDSLGVAYVKAGTIIDGFKAKAIALGATVSTALGTISIIVMAIYALYAAIKFVLNSFDMLNKFSGELSSALKDNENVLTTAISAYTKYSELQKETGFSTRALIDSNTIAANTFSQVTEAIDKQVDAFKTWQANQTSLSAWWDQAFGTSNFDKLKQNLADDLVAAAKYSPNMRDNLTKGAAEIKAATTIEQLTNIKNKYNQVLFKEAELLKSTNAQYTSLTDGMKTASIAITTFYKKDEIKNENIRTIVDKLKELRETKDFTVQLKVLAGIEKDSPLYKELPTALQKVIDTQVVIQEQAKAIAAIEKEASEAKLAAQTKVNKPEDSFDYVMEKKTAYYLQTVKNILSNLIDNAIDGIDRFFTKLGQDFIKAAMRLDFLSMGKAILVGIKDAILFAMPGLKFLLGDPNVDYSKARAEGIAEADKNKPKPNSEIRKTAAETAAAKAKAAELSAQAAAMAQAEAGKPGRGSATKANITQTELIAKIKQAEEKFRAKDNGNSEKSTGNSLRKLELEAELRVYKAQEAEQSRLSALDKERLGYITETRLESLYKYKLDILEKSSEQERLDLTIATAKSANDSHMTAVQRKSLVDNTLKAFDKELETKKAILKTDKAKAFEESRIAQYSVSIKISNEAALSRAEETISLAKEAGILSQQEVIDSETLLTMKKLNNEQDLLSNKIKDQGYSAPADEAKQLEINAARKYAYDQRDIKTTNLQKNIKESTLQNQISLYQSIMDMEIESGKVSIKILNSRINAEEDLYKSKFEAAEKAKDYNKMEELSLERINRKYKEQKELHEANKKNLDTLTTKQKAQTIYDEAVKQADDFASKMKDNITGTFEAVYAGMDAAIDELTTKWMKSEKISIKDLITTFRNTAAEEFRKLAADQMKSAARNGIASILKNVLGNKFGIDTRTNEQRALDYARITSEATAKLAKLDGGDTVFGKVQEVIGDAGSTAEDAANSIDGLVNNIKDSFFGLFDTGGTLMTLLNGVGSGMQGIFGGIVQMLSGNFGGGASSIGGGIGGILGSLGSGLGSILGETNAGVLGGGTGLLGAATNLFSSIFSANGNIMTEYGPLKLNAYARGGITNSPMVSVIGEGTKPEAYVPLPDGRSIPVTMQGGNTSQGNNINIQVSVDASGGTSATATGSNPEDSRQLGIIIASKVREEIVNQQRSGGLLNRRS